MGISYNPPTINPGGSTGGGPVSHPILDAILGGLDRYNQAADRKRAESRSSADLEMRKMEFQLQKAQHDMVLKQQEYALQQAKHQQDLLKEQGKALQQYGQYMTAPQAAQMFPLVFQQTPSGPPVRGPGPNGAQVAQMPQAQGPMVAGPVYDPQQQLQHVLGGMSPDAVPGFLQQLTALQKTQGGKMQAIQTGDKVTAFDPSKGFYNPETGTWGLSAPRGMSQDQKDEAAQNRAIREETLNEARLRRQEVQARVVTNQFNSRVKGLRERGALINQTLLTLDSALNDPNPANRRVLMSSAIANFVQAADQKAQLRYQLLQYFKANADPSLKGRLDIVATRLAKGTYPDYVYEGLLAHIKSLKALATEEYTKQYNGEVKRHPDLAGWLPAADEFFTMDSSTLMPSASTAGGLPPLPPLP